MQERQPSIVPNAQRHNDVLWQVDEFGVATLTLNRTKKHNAFDACMIDLIIHRLDYLALRTDVRCLVLRSNGKHFSSGADLAWMQSMANSTRKENLVEGFCQHNINCSIAESLKRFEPLMVQADKYHVPVRGYLSCVVDCPYDGATSPTQVANISQALIELGCYEVSLGDTIGTGTPNRVKEMLESVLASIPNQRLAVHFHDTWGQALANIYQALSMGITTVDSSVAGLGGCPYAHGASGNVATEDVLYLCQGLGIETGVDLELQSDGKHTDASAIQANAQLI